MVCLGFILVLLTHTLLIMNALLIMILASDHGLKIILFYIYLFIFFLIKFIRYVQATTGSKNVIILLDTSASMSQNSPTRLDAAKAATKSVINTLGN